VAVAHTLPCIAWAVMRYDGDSIDAGTDYYERRDQRNHEHPVRYHQHAGPARRPGHRYPARGRHLTAPARR
jgi:hypothetical protein